MYLNWPTALRGEEWLSLNVISSPESLPIKSKAVNLLSSRSFYQQPLLISSLNTLKISSPQRRLTLLCTSVTTFKHFSFSKQVNNPDKSPRSIHPAEPVTTPFQPGNLFKSSTSINTRTDLPPRLSPVPTTKCQSSRCACFSHYSPPRRITTVTTLPQLSQNPCQIS